MEAATLRSYKRDRYFCEINNFVNSEPQRSVITRAEIESYFEKIKTDRDADLPFMKKYGTDHFYQFSRVGFNKKKDQAILTIRWQSISLTGSDTSYVLLSKINNEWKIIRKEVIYAS